MEIFAEDGPRALPSYQDEAKARALKQEETSERLNGYQMIDFMEFNLRKVVIQNAKFCAAKCHLFDNLED